MARLGRTPPTAAGDRPEHEARLTAVSAPRLNFPAANNASLARLAQNAGTTVDGVPTPPPPRLVEGARVY